MGLVGGRDGLISLEDLTSACRRKSTGVFNVYSVSESDHHHGHKGHNLEGMHIQQIFS